MCIGVFITSFDCNIAVWWNYRGNGVYRLCIVNMVSTPDMNWMFSCRKTYFNEHIILTFLVCLVEPSALHFSSELTCVYIIDLFNAWVTMSLLSSISNKTVYQWVTLCWGLWSFSLWSQLIRSNFQVHLWHSSSRRTPALHDDKLAPMLFIAVILNSSMHHLRSNPVRLVPSTICLLALQCSALGINCTIFIYF